MAAFALELLTTNNNCHASGIKEVMYGIVMDGEGTIGYLTERKEDEVDFAYFILQWPYTEYGPGVDIEVQSMYDVTTKILDRIKKINNQ